VAGPPRDQPAARKHGSSRRSTNVTWQSRRAGWRRKLLTVAACHRERWKTKAWWWPSSEEEVAVVGGDLGSSLQHEGWIGLVWCCTKGGSGRSGPALTEMRATTVMTTRGGAASRGLRRCNLDKMQWQGMRTLFPPRIEPMGLGQGLNGDGRYDGGKDLMT
jgi:hypothetical protein